ncbi:MAG: hypothetical protein EXS35_12305 [Pedosphaera sp.]|nr:hypothetical protein [Pedosphaera sp.]
MAFTEMDRTVIEIRELLAKTQDKDKVVRILITRGMDEAEAHDLVYAIYKETLSFNRKSALWATIGCGTGFVVLGTIVLATHFFPGPARGGHRDRRARRDVGRRQTGDSLGLRTGRRLTPCRSRNWIARCWKSANCSSPRRTGTKSFAF